jgi:hypothetical protein
MRCRKNCMMNQKPTRLQEYLIICMNMKIGMSVRILAPGYEINLRPERRRWPLAPILGLDIVIEVVWTAPAPRPHNR